MLVDHQVQVMNPEQPGTWDSRTFPFLTPKKKNVFPDMETLHHCVLAKRSYSLPFDSIEEFSFSGPQNKITVFGQVEILYSITLFLC